MNTRGQRREADASLLPPAYGNAASLRQYVSLVAQAPGGGLRDKPGKSPDAYHTCYNLSGASSATLPPVFSRPAYEQLVQSFRPASNSLAGADNSRTTGQDTEETDAQRSCQVYGSSLAWQVGRSRLEDATKHEDLVRTLSSLGSPDTV